MNRPSLLTGLLLIGIGLAFFAWKVWGYDLPVVPDDPEGLWRVELVITVRGAGERGSVRAPLPSSGPGQIVYDEHSAADRLRFEIRREEGQRTGIWRGRLRDIHEISHGFQVQLSGARMEVPGGRVEGPPADILRLYGGPTPRFPADAPETFAVLESLSLPPPAEVTARLRSIFALVNHEIEDAEQASEDALIVLANREGSERGKAGLLVTLLRAAGIPARPVTGLWLQRGTPVTEASWAEAWVGDQWVPLSPSLNFFGRLPEELLVLHAGSFEGVTAVGAEAISYRYHALRERLSPEELAALMMPPNPLLQALSLYRLPVATQAALRALLLLPLGALFMAMFRNLVGLPTYGTFLPVLIAFALRDFPLALGLGLVTGVIGVGVLGRLVLERLRLLMVPRLSILMCMVVLAVTALALLGGTTENRNLFAGVLFPIVILTMLVERFSIVLAEEGTREALVRGLYSLVVVAAIYPVFQSRTAEHLMFGFPELVIAVMGWLVLIGAYTGYRVTDLVRFRAFGSRWREAS